MTWANTDRERIGQIRHATRNRCGAVVGHGDHIHFCTGPGDHNGFGSAIEHADRCQGRVFTWLTDEQREQLRGDHARALRAELAAQDAEARERKAS